MAVRECECAKVRTCSAVHSAFLVGLDSGKMTGPAQIKPINKLIHTHISICTRYYRMITDQATHQGQHSALYPHK